MARPTIEPRGASGPGNTFERDEYLAALEPPRFDLGGGKVLVGRILSADEWFRYEDRLQLASKDALTRAALRALMQEMTDLTFAGFDNGKPWPFRRRVLVSELLFALPYRAQLKQFESFTLAQAKAQEGTTLRAKAQEATGGTP
jgi:hypothetical protein